MNHDLMFVLHPDVKFPAPLGNSHAPAAESVFFYFGVQDCLWIGDRPCPKRPVPFAVSAHPNPFNPYRRR